MSVAGAIRAGAAYVEVFLEHNRVTAGLASIQAKLRGWSAGLGRMGSGMLGGGLPGPLGAIAHFASSPAGVLAGLVAAAKIAANSGTEIANLAEKAGTSVEAISSLGYAARRCHVDIQGLATGIKKMQVNIVAAARGGAEAQKALTSLGLSAAELGRLLPEEQFRRIASGIAAIQNPAERTAAAVKIFGRSGADLLPLLLQGADGIAKWEARARALGLVANGEAAEGARRFGQLLGDLRDVATSGVKVIGGAAIPEMTRFVNWLVKGIQAARDWIKEHKGLVVVALQVSGAVVAGGLALSALSAILRNAAGAISLVLVPLRLLSGLVSGLVSISASIAAGIAAAAWSAAAWMAHAAWAGLGLVASALGTAFSAAAGIVATIWPAAAALASVAWTVASAVASAAWVAGSVIVAAAWSVLSAIPAVLATAWSAAAAIASAAWTAVAFALDAVLTFAATGAMALPALVVAGIVAGVALLGAAIYLQLTRSLSRAPEIGKQAGVDIREGIVAETTDVGNQVGVGWLAGIRGAANAMAEGFRQAVTTVGGYFSELWQGFWTDAVSTFGLVGQALLSGNIMQAWPVITAFAKVEWQRLVLFMQETWAALKPKLVEVFKAVAPVVTNLTTTIGEAITKLTETLDNALDVWATITGKLDERLQSKIAKAPNWMEKVAATPEFQAIQAMPKGEERDKAWAALRERFAPKSKPSVVEDVLGGEPGKTEEDPFAAQRAALAEAQRQLAEARKALAGELAKPTTTEKTLGLPGVELPDIGNLAAAKSSVTGTFGASALWGMGGSSMERDIADMKQETKRVAENAEKQVILLGRIEEYLGEGGVALAQAVSHGNDPNL